MSLITNAAEQDLTTPLLEGQPGPGSYDGSSREAGPIPTKHLLAQGTFTRNLGTLEAFGIAISIVIGSGIFTSPGSIDANIPSPGVALLIWLVGGVLAWTGATTMAELGTAIPGEGGLQPYLQHIYGDVFGFLAGWTWVVAVMPATLAILSIVFVESIYSAAGVTDQSASLEHKLLSVLVVVLTTVSNSISTKASTRLNNFFVASKFLTISAVVVTGLAVVVLQIADPSRDVGGRDWCRRPWFGMRETITPDGGRIDWKLMSKWDLFGHYSVALYGALWAYSGWDKAVYVSAELSAPARQLPLAINTAIPTVILCFTAANAAYYVLLPWDAISQTDSVAVTAITRLLGPSFGVVAAVLICLVVAGSLLSNSFIAGRMAVAAANKQWLPSSLGLIGRVGILPRSDAFSSGDTTPGYDGDDDGPDVIAPKSDAPINALILAALLSTLYILLGNFRALLTFNGLGEFSFFFLTVLGSVVLRYREPELERPYKPAIAIPVVFTIVSGFVVARGAIFAPLQAAILLPVWLVGLAYYWIKRSWPRSPQNSW